MTSLTNNPHPQPKHFFQAQTTRLAKSFEWVRSAYRTREIPVQSHVQSHVLLFLPEPLELTRMRKCQAEDKEL